MLDEVADRLEKSLRRCSSSGGQKLIYPLTRCEIVPAWLRSGLSKRFALSECSLLVGTVSGGGSNIFHKRLRQTRIHISAKILRDSPDIVDGAR